MLNYRFQSKAQKGITLFLVALFFLFSQAHSQPVAALLAWDGNIDNMDALPKTLTETGFDKTKTDIFVPYEVNVPQYRNYMSAQRYVYVPAGQKITPGDTLNYTFPIGTVFFREIWVDQVIGNPVSRVPVEVQIQVRNPNNEWSRLVYYYEGTSDARLVTGEDWIEKAFDVDITGLGYPFINTDLTPATHLRINYQRSGYDCTACHWNNSANGFITQQLNKGTQLADLVAKGILASVPAPAVTVTKWFNFADAEGTLEQKSKSYIAANCGHCHTPERLESGMTSLFMYFDEAISTANLWKEDAVAPLVKGIPDSSKLIQRLIKAEMPQGEVTYPDAVALKQLWEWIGSADGTPAPPFPNVSLGPVSVDPHFGHGITQNNLAGNIRNGILNLANLRSADVQLFDLNGSKMPLTKLASGRYHVNQNLTRAIYIVKAGTQTLKIQNILH